MFGRAFSQFNPSVGRWTTGPSPMVNLARTLIVKHRQYTYAELVAAASGAALLPFVDAVPGCLIYPLALHWRMRRNAIAGTSTTFSFRWSLAPTVSLFASNPNANFNSGGTDQMSVYMPEMAGALLTFTSGLNVVGSALQINNNSATAATGCVGTLDVTAAVAIVPVTLL